MPRSKGSGTTGPVRSLRLPRELDAWFEERLRAEPERSASELLLALMHGGLRLRSGYMIRHRRALEAILLSGDRPRYESYVSVLEDTFGSKYVEHLHKWLAADGIVAVNKNGQKKPNASR